MLCPFPKNAFSQSIMLCPFPKKCGKGLDKTPTLMYNKSKTKNIK